MLATGIELKVFTSFCTCGREARQAPAERHNGGSNPPTYFLGEWLSGNSSGLQNHHTQVRVLPLLFRSIAQLVERRALNAEVPGSSPGRPVGDVAELANAPVC